MVDAAVTSDREEETDDKTCKVCINGLRERHTGRGGRGRVGQVVTGTVCRRKALETRFSSLSRQQDLEN